MSNDPGRDRIPDAYDVDGRPLFYHPPESGVVKNTTDKKKPNKDSEVLRLKHERSQREYPNIDFDEDEYIEISVKRHGIGIALIWISEVVIGVVIAILCVLLMRSDDSFVSLDEKARGFISLALLAVMLLLFVFGVIGTSIFNSNKILVTNKRIIQRISHGLFDNTQQIIDLASVEDVSYRQSNIFQNLLGYGSIRMSTIGDETTYSLNFVSNPNEQVEKISDVVHSVKIK